MMTGTPLKHSYTVPCRSAFRDAVEALAVKRHVNVGDLARSILLVISPDAIAAFPDPGDPPVDDRETVILKSGPAEGRPWRRKPRLQVRMPPGHEIPFIRRALGLALALDQGGIAVQIKAATAPAPLDLTVQEELARLRAAVSVLAFEPLPQGVGSREDALHILGFPPGTCPDTKTLRAKFRMLATIHHPDSGCGSHQRMAQLNAAMDLLRLGAA